MFTQFASFLATKGLDQNHPIWQRLQILSLIGVIAGSTDDKIIGWGAWLGLHLSPVAAHWIVLASALVLIVAGKLDASSFTKAAANIPPGGQK